MELERRALYNSLRMNWLLDSTLQVEAWQVDNYREMTFNKIFDLMAQLGFALDKTTFVALAENVYTPEELVDDLLADSELDQAESDQLYLLIFEAWRRFLPQRPCLSVFCDELDHQIYLYDTGKLEHNEGILDAVANLEVILDENTDQGGDPIEVFELVSAGCANDIESFLYDFINEQIDSENKAYAAELIEDFSDYVHDLKWFDFLRARILASTDVERSNKLIQELVYESAKEPDLEFNLAVTSFLVHGGEPSLFAFLVKTTIHLLSIEEDFQDFLELCIDYYHCLDQEEKEYTLQNILKSRTKNNLEDLLAPTDPQVAEVVKLCCAALKS